MTRRAFYSFNYSEDAWRASQVRNMGLIEGNRFATDNEWQDVSKGGEGAITRWINQQMEHRSVLIVLIGRNTAGRKWINYEICHAWKKHMGVCGIYINNLLDENAQPSIRGQNPFERLALQGRNLSLIVPTLNPKGYTSKDVYENIKKSMPNLIESAIAIRSLYD